MQSQYCLFKTPYKALLKLLLLGLNAVLCRSLSAPSLAMAAYDLVGSAAVTGVGSGSASLGIQSGAMPISTWMGSQVLASRGKEKKS